MSGEAGVCAVVVALVVGGLPLQVRAGEPTIPRDEPVEPLSSPTVVAPSSVPPELAAPPVAALGEARRLEADARFAEAARIYEAQWAATADARFLYHAAVARSRAGHHAVALRLLLQCEEALARAEVSEVARQFVADARARETAATLPVQWSVVEATGRGLVPVPEAALAAARTTVTRLGPTGEPVFGDMFEIAGRPPGELHLDPGVWLAQVELPGFVPAALRLVVDGDQGPQALVVHRRKVVVDLRFMPERALRGARLRLRAMDHASPLALERDLVSPTATVTLTPGPWRLEVRARRHGADLHLPVEPNQRSIDVVLTRRRPVDDPWLTQDRKLLLGALGSFTATYLAGIGCFVAAVNLEKRAERRDAAAHADAGVEASAQAMIEASYPAARLHRDLALATDLQVAGGVLSGFSIGTVLSALPMALKVRRRASVFELGVGAALMAGGAGWLGWSLGERARLLDDPSRRASSAALERGEGHRIASSVFVGVGVGLTTFAAIVLASDAAARRRQARAFSSAPWSGSGLVGWSLAGRF